MNVLAFIFGYCLVGWIVMLIMGWFDEDNTCNADLIWAAGLMWPLFLVVLFVWKTLEFLIALGDKFKWFGKFFRPYSLGQDIYTFVKRKGNENDDD